MTRNKTTQLSLLQIGVSVVAFFAAVTLHSIVFADGTITKVHLKSGSVIEAVKVTEISDSYLIETKEGITFKLRQSAVDHAVKPNEIDKLYAKFCAGIENTVDSHWKAFLWIDQQRTQQKKRSLLRDEREYHLRSVLRLEPDHADARKELGYFQRDDGTWVIRAQHLKSLGLELRGGRVIDPVWEAFENQKKEQKKLDAKARGAIMRAYKGLGGNRHAEHQATIEGLSGALAAELIADFLLKDRKASVEKKLFLIDQLRKETLRGVASRTALIQTAVTHDDDAVREACVDALKEDGSPVIVKAFTSKLVDNAPKHQIKFAAEALESIGDPEAIPALINGLQTKHVQMSGSGNTNTGMVNGNFSFGSDKKVKMETSNNRAVLRALEQLTNQTHGFNEERWIQWLATANLPNVDDLRRDQ